MTDPSDPRFAHLPPPPVAPTAWPPLTPPPPPWPGRAASTGSIPPPDPVEVRRRIELDVRNLVLVLGVACLVAAAVSFVAVNWESFDASMRAALLVGTTVAAFLGGVVTRERGLGGTATALSWLTMVLAFVDLFAIEKASFADVSGDVVTAVGGTVLFALFLGLGVWRRDLAMTTGAVLAWLLGSSSALIAWDVTGADIWVLPFAAVFGWLQWRSSSPESGSWQRYGLTLAVVAVPAVLTALGDPNLTRPLVVIVVTTAVLVAGLVSRQLAAVWVGGASLGVLVGAQLVDMLRGVPGWAVFGLVGIVLLGVGAFFEHRVRHAAVVAARPSDGGATGAPAVPAWR